MIFEEGREKRIMASFTYEAIDKAGKTKKANVEADSIEKARAILKNEGYSILSIGETSLLNKDISFNIKKKVSSRDLGVFCRQFVSISKAGVNVVTALAMLAEQTENKALKQALKNVRDNVEKGDSMALAMRRETVFPPLLLNMVDAGEASGNLESAMGKMASHFEKDAKLKGIVKKALMYPCVLIVVMIAVIIVLLVVVIPNFQSMFDQIGGKLPAFTVAVVAMSQFLQEDWIILIGILVIAIVAFKMYNKTPQGKRQIAKIVLKLPVFGVLIQKQSCARFAETLSTLVSSGMGMVEAVEITGKTLDNVLYQDAVLDAAKQVQQGVALSVPLKASGLFPPMIMHMLSIGEETGNLEEMLNNSAEYYNEEVEMATQQMTALMEPVIIVCMAGVVCLLIAAIYGPMMSMYQQLGAQA